MNVIQSINEDKYFTGFSNLIRKLKKNESIDSATLEFFYINIKNIPNLTFQDIITYMLYCFEVIELTQKWKLKKLINYDYFLENMEAIYNEIFCLDNSTFNNRIIAATGFGNIIEKTINYSIDEKIESILETYLKCIGEYRTYSKNHNIILLRGNLYCQIYNIVKDNLDINNLCHNFLNRINNIFDHPKYIKSAEDFYKNTLMKKDLSYLELNNFLSFKAYNNCDITSKEIKQIFAILSKKYSKNFFDKKIYIYLIENFTRQVISEKKLNALVNLSFGKKEDSLSCVYIDYNMIDYSFYSNLTFLKDIYTRINKLSDSDRVNDNLYIELMKIKDKLIAKKNSENTSILNYDTFINYTSLIEFNKYLDEKEPINFHFYFNNLLNKITNIKDKNSVFEDKPLTNNELFIKLYSNEEIKTLFKKYPLLECEYDSNGNYKDIAKLLKEKILLKDKSNSKEQVRLYELLVTYRDADIYRLLNDYYSLFILDSIDDNLIKEKEEALKNTLPNLVKQKILLCGKIPDDTLSEIYQDYINPCIKKISQNRVSNQNFESTKDFLNYQKSNSDNYFGICKLQDILKNLS